LRISVAQHSKDKLLINKLRDLFNCGSVSNHSNGNAIVFLIYRFDDMYNKIIPIFHEYKIRGIKSLDFQDFCEAAKLMKKRFHLTKEGLEQIQGIKSRMNRSRQIL
jgi:hypothetical protein